LGERGKLVDGLAAVFMFGRLVAIGCHEKAGSMISKSKIDHLGDRLKANQATEQDLRLLDEFRRSFSSAYEIVIRRIRDELGLQPTGRPAKSTTSISDKLSRESIRLTQIQDIAGCRLNVRDVLEQDRVVLNLRQVFPTGKVTDRRTSPSHGYRAVHLIVNIEEKPIEIQIRTSLQHTWAQLSEKVSDIYDPAIKYGSGNEVLLAFFKTTSDRIAEIEMYEHKYGRPAGSDPAADEVIRRMKKEMFEFLEWMDTELTGAKKGKNDISD
jgi:putative GTP pyrophosphokinase